MEKWRPLQCYTRLYYSNLSSCSNESDTSDAGIGRDDEFGDYDELPGTPYNMDRIPQAWWEGLDFTVAERNDGGPLAHNTDKPVFLEIFCSSLTGRI